MSDALAQYPIPVLDVAVNQRVAFAESAAKGLTVLETDPGGVAAEEVRGLARKLKELL